MSFYYSLVHVQAGLYTPHPEEGLGQATPFGEDSLER